MAEALVGGRGQARCYVCGKPLGNDFILFSPADDVDRVFVAGADCAEQVEDDAQVFMPVQRVNVL